jgi:Uncharacterised protein conserved in bacteria (DUF2336)
VSLAVLIPELEGCIRQGSATKLTEMAERLTDLFIVGADRFGAEHIDLFGDILCRLVDQAEATTLSGIAKRIAPVANAPLGLVRRFANHDDIAVAGPVLRLSPCLPDLDLAAVAARMGLPHLVAIAQRQMIAPPVTDVLVERGDGNILHTIASNHGAQFSDFGFGILAKRAAGDDALVETLGLRPDIPAGLLRRLVRDAPAAVRQRLIVVAYGKDGQNTILYREAQSAILTLVNEGKLDAAQLHAFAECGQRAETVAALSALSRVPIDRIDRLFAGERLDGLLIIGRALGIGWPTLRAIVVLRHGRQPNLDEVRSNYERLSEPSAIRVLSFWRDRSADPSR